MPTAPYHARLAHYLVELTLPASMLSGLPADTPTAQKPGRSTSLRVWAALNTLSLDSTWHCQPLTWPTSLVRRLRHPDQSIRCSSTCPRRFPPPLSISHSRPAGTRPGCAPSCVLSLSAADPQYRFLPPAFPFALVPPFSRPSSQVRGGRGAVLAWQTAELQRHSTYTEADLQVR